MKSISIVIYGRHSPDWSASLGVKAPVWLKLQHALSQQQITLNVYQIKYSSRIYQDDHAKSADLIIPLMERHMKSLGTYLLTRPHRRRPKALMPSSEIVDTWSDKIKFLSFADQHQLSTYLPIVYGVFLGQHADRYAHRDPQTTGILRPIQFPCIFKSPDLNNGQGIEIIHDVGQLVTAIHVRVNTPYIIQEYIEGQTEYVTHCVCNQGEILNQHTYKFYYEGEFVVKNSDTPVKKCRRQTLTPTQTEILRKFVAGAKFTGFCNFNYKINTEGTPMIFEINPRLGGSILKPEHTRDLYQMMLTLLQTGIRDPTLKKLMG